MAQHTLTISIDTEEDNWGAFVQDGATTANIRCLPELQDIFDSRGARPTYLVNRAPVVAPDSVAILGAIGEREGVEIGAHCHPWNTPPFTGEGEHRSMMCGLTVEENRGKVREVSQLIASELGLVPRSFRAGRWGYGPTVAAALAAEGFEVDCSVSPFIDWSNVGGPDYTLVHHRPYRFRPERPFEPVPDGEMVQLPTTIGFLKGPHVSRARLRHRLERSVLSRFRVIGVLDRAGLLTRRWLSPETSSAEEMIRLIDAWFGSGESMAQLTFHSCTLLPGVTPFVRDLDDKRRFLRSIDAVLAHCVGLGCEFKTLVEFGREFRDSSRK